MGFEFYHPMVNLIFFASVALGAAFFDHPAFILISFVFSAAYCIKRNARRGALLFCVALAASLVFAVIYGSTEHFGATVICKNSIGNTVTLEASFYGLSLGVRGAALIMWASCFNSVFTTDKTVYLFGRASPRLALYLSILFRAVPRTGAQRKRIALARRGIGKRGAFAVLSATVSRMIDAFASLSSSMRSRGATLKGRRAFSIFRFDDRDRCGVVLMFALMTVCGVGVSLGQTDMIYDPRLIAPPIGPLAIAIYFAYALFCSIPLALEVWQLARFKARKSRI